ncbi:uncharacterized protein LOC103575971 [Microplitis demolitor]|uniref:uncharacterized protein LOC103575971 n=1 Tax=Microplitis demolitor TaxID=69319 RepID=UPI0004CD677F|nr:uncharacterized protein LOC103575971 [Microplitis demolitor]
MSLHNKNLFIICVIIILMINHIKSQCLETTACTCLRYDKRGYDLRPLAHQGPFHNKNNNITFQPCNDVDLTFKVSNDSDCHLSSVCLLDGLNKSVNLGKVEESAWKYSLINTNDVRLIFHHSNYVTNIKLECCHNCPTELVYHNSTNSEYNLIFISESNCLVYMRRGLSTGSVLVILLLVFSGIYFASGALALKYFRGAVGLELIPNYEFWSDLPGLVRDGVTFTLSGCSAVSYERI